MRSLLLITFFFLTISGMAQFNIPLDQNVVNGHENYQNVEPGDIIYVQTGQREELLLQNLHGTEAKPIVLKPTDWTRPVVISSEGNYGISIRNCSHIRITGWQGIDNQYGIRIINVEGDSGVGIGMSDKSTNIEIEYIEIGNVGFAGILSKTEPDCDDPGTFRGAFTQENTRIHHCYIHDTEGEGLYVGSTQFFGQEIDDCELILPPLLEGVEIHHNRIERTGWDGIQISSAISDCEIYNNVLIDCSLRETVAQMSGILIGGGTTAKCYNNTITDCRATGILVFGNGGTKVFNNLIIRPAMLYEPGNSDKREHGIYINDKTNLDNSFYGIYSNTIIQPKSDGIRIGPLVNFQTIMYNNLIVDPGAWEVYENDNTDRIGNDAFVYLENPDQDFRSAANAFVRLMSLPKFVNASNDDYRLSYNSRYVDAGINLTDQGGVSFDIEDKPRPLLDGWDIGAFEYGDPSFNHLVSSPSDPVGVKMINKSNGSHELVISVFEPGVMRWKLLSITGQVHEQSKTDWYEIGDYYFSLGNSYRGIQILSIEGPGWRISEKVLVN